jgi:hypothetical protein
MCKDAFTSGWESGVNWMASSVGQRTDFASSWKMWLEREFNVKKEKEE